MDSELYPDRRAKMQKIESLERRDVERDNSEE